MRIVIWIVAIAITAISLNAQDMGYDIRGTWGKPIQKDKLADAETMVDINPGYPSSWINQADYISAEITTIHNGKELMAEGSNDILSAEQRKLIHSAEIGSDIRVEVKYHVQDFLKKKLEVKTLNFGLTVVPAVQAEYIGGQESLMDYLKDKTVDILPASEEENIKLAMIKFVIDESGKVTQPIISQTSQDKDIDAIVLKAIQQMPDWKPAQDASGHPVKQSFQFVIGNSIGC